MKEELDDEKQERRTRRANGMGTLFKRGNMWWCKYMTKGILTAKSLGIHVHDDEKSDKQMRKAAEAALYAETAPLRLSNEIDTLLYLKAKIEYLASNRKSVTAALKGAAGIKLKDAAEKYMSKREKDDVTDNTLDIYLNDLNGFVKWAGADKYMSSITLAIAEAYAASLEKKKIAPATFNRKLVSLSSVWKTLGIVDVVGGMNPWREIPHKKKDTVARDTLTEEEIADLKKNAATRYGGDLRMLVVIGEYTGLRLTDAATLRWSEIDYDKMLITKKTGKTGAIAYIPILPEFKKELEEQRKKLASWSESELSELGDKEAKNCAIPKGFNDFVVPRMAKRSGKGKSALCAAMKKAFVEAGVEVNVKTEGSKRRRPVKGFHSLRATWVTRCQAAGIPVQIIMSTVGHATVSITQHYTHIKEREVIEAFKKAGVIDGDVEADRS